MVCMYICIYMYAPSLRTQNIRRTDQLGMGLVSKKSQYSLAQQDVTEVLNLPHIYHILGGSADQEHDGKASDAFPCARGHY